MRICSALLLVVVKGAPWTPWTLSQAFRAAGSPGFFDPDQLMTTSGRLRVASELAESSKVANPIKMFLIREADLGTAPGGLADFTQQLVAITYPLANDRTYLLLGLLVASTAKGGMWVAPYIRYIYPPDFVTFALRQPALLLGQAQAEAAAVKLAEAMAQPYRFVDIAWREVIIFVGALVLLLLCGVEVLRLNGRRAAERRLRGTFTRYRDFHSAGWQLEEFTTQACLVCLREKIVTTLGDQTLVVSLCELTCGHRFHAECIKDKCGGLVSCPLCSGGGQFITLNEYEHALVDLHARRERFWMSRRQVARLFADPHAPQISDRAASKPRSELKLPEPLAVVA